MHPSKGRTAILLAGEDKALLEFYGETLLEIVFYKLRPIFDKIFIIASSNEGKSSYEKLLSEDILVNQYKGNGVMAGVLTGLEACRNENAFVAACDAPFINKKAVEIICSKQDYDAVIPRYVNGKIEPLHALYKVGPSIMAIENAFKDERFEPKGALANLENVLYLPVGELMDVDPRLETFFRVNSEVDLQVAKDRMQKKVLKGRIKKAERIKSGVSKTLETEYVTYFKVPGTDEEHEIRYDKRKDQWTCDCKYFAMKGNYCSHIIAAQKAL